MQLHNNSERLFQSTPDLINRENNLWRGKTRLYTLFQSTPDLINRENDVNP